MVRDLPRLNKKTLEQFQHPRNLSERLARDDSTGSETVGRELRMLIVGYCYGIRSERRLCEEAHLNLAYRWFCRLSLEDEVPNHSTFSKNRHGRFRGARPQALCSTRCYRPRDLRVTSLRDLHAL